MRELFAKPFFPDPGFAWGYVLVLLLCAALAAVYDTRTSIIPKWITIGTLVLGLVANTIRGAWLGSQGIQVWQLTAGSTAIGTLDGFLFAFIGFIAGFGLFFVMWILGVCGGGDVKLMAALSAWFGPLGVAVLLILSTAVLFVWVLGSLIFGGRTLKSLRRPTKSTAAPVVTAKARQKRVTFSFPAAVAVLLIVFGIFGEDLGVRNRTRTLEPQRDARVDRSPTLPG